MTPAAREYADTVARAVAECKADGCTRYINAFVRIRKGEPVITAFIVSDWYCTEATVAIVSRYGEVDTQF